MREWKLTSGDPMAPRFAADARAGRTNYLDDTVWQLRLGGPDEPAVSLETRYGGRVGLARIVPLWSINRRQVHETQGYHTPPRLVAFTADYARVQADLTLAIRLTYEIWVMESQAVGGRITCANSGNQPQALTLDLTTQAVRENKALQVFFLTLDNRQVALQLGNLPFLQPVLLMDGATQTSISSRLSRSITLPPGEPVAIRWVLAGLPSRDASLLLAHKWLRQENWDTHLAALEARSAAEPQIETGHPDWDLALAWSQQIIQRSLINATGNLPHPSFVTARRPNMGYPPSGGYGSSFGHPWSGQSLPDALLIAPAAALAAPEIGQGIVRNFLAVQRDDGWIDARPGLDGQRVNVIAPPLLATLAYAVYTFTRDKNFLAECLDGLVKFFNRWLRPDLDRDGDGVPEWTQIEQGAFADSPTLGRARRWAQGVDVTALEAPDLLTYLVREARTLLGICKLLDRDDVAREIKPRYEALAAALNEFWDEASGGFRYRDRDSHACPTGEVVFTGKGDQPLTERITLPHPSRLILRVIGSMGRPPKIGCTLEGIDRSGKPARETLGGDAFEWSRSMGSATTNTVWREITRVKFDGLSRVFKIEINTVNLSQPDQSLLMPLWSGALDDDQAARLIAQITDPAQYGRAYGIPGCPANSPVYDPANLNGCGGLWPDWNARIGWALIERDHSREAADLFRRVLAAQMESLKTEKAFRSLYNPDTGAGLGDADSFQGAVSLGWFARLFGAFALDPGAVVISDPFAFAGETITWTQHGVRITRSDKGTEIVFPSKHKVTLKPDEADKVVRDPKAKPKRPAAPKPAPQPAPEPPPAPAETPKVAAERPDEGLLPDDA
jgi:hypothetical protein